MELLKFPFNLVMGGEMPFVTHNAFCRSRKVNFKTTQALKMYESDEYPSGDETMTRTFHFPRPFVTTRIRIDQVEGAIYKLFKVRIM